MLKTLPSRFRLVCRGAVAILMVLLVPRVGWSAGAEVEPSLESVRKSLEAGRYVEAEQAIRGLIQEFERAHGDSSLQVADALDLLATALRKGGKASEPESQEVCQRAVRIKTMILGEDDPGTALSLQNLGASLLSAGDLLGAKVPLQRSLRIRERVLGPNHLEVSSSLLWLGALHHRAGDPVEAEPLMRRALSIRQSQLQKDHPEIADCLNALAGVLHDLGDFAAAEPLLEEAFRIWRAARGAHHPSVGLARHNLGVLLGEIGDWEGALVHLQAAIRIRKDRLGKPHPLVASTLLVLGDCHWHLRDLKAAEQALSEALKIVMDAYGAEDAETGWALTKLGLLQVERKRWDRADSLLSRSLAIQERALGPDHYNLAWALEGLASVAWHRSDLMSSAKFRERALAIREKAYGPSHPDVATSLLYYAAVLAELGELRRSQELALRAADSEQEHLRLTAEGLAERQVLLFSSTRPRALDTALAVAARSAQAGLSVDVPRIWDAIVKSRTIALDEMAVRQRIANLEPSDTALTGAAKVLEGARRRLANLLVRGPGTDPIERFRNALSQARESVARAERRLASLSRVYKAQESQRRIGFQALASTIPPDGALLAYCPYGMPGGDRGYSAFLLRAQSEPRIIDLGSAEHIESLVRQWSRAIRNVGGTSDGRSTAEGKCRRVGAQLRKAIWDPVAPDLGSVKRLYLIPGGALFQISFDALPSTSTTYLIERGPVFHYLTSERDLLRRAGVHGGSGLLALGGASFGNRSTNLIGGSRARGVQAPPTRARDALQSGCVEFGEITFSPLPMSELEVREIASMWPAPRGVTVLTGDAATESAFKRLAPGRSVLHVATHGFFLNSECYRPGRGRGISGISRPGDRRARRPASIPLILSGLALAKANQRHGALPSQDDGILTAEEIVSLELSSVELVVLSACDTGLGELHAGEGVIGLRRSFQIAGCGTAVMSLWSVEDRDAREWMRNFYKYVTSDRRSVSAAAHEASLKALLRRRARAQDTHPFRWAGFVATGDAN